MRIFYFIAIWVFGVSSGAFAQEIGVLRADTLKNVYIQADPYLDSLLKMRTLLNQSEREIYGYVIQLYNGNIHTARATGEKFAESFPLIRQEIVHEDPEYKVLVGAYRTKEEAYRDLAGIRNEFGGAFVRQKMIKIYGSSDPATETPAAGNPSGE